MQLRKPHAFGVLDHHQAGIWHIDADFDHRGRHQQLQLIGAEAGHHLLFLGRFHAAVQQTDLQVWKRLLQVGIGVERGLQLQAFGFLDQRADPVGLPALAAGLVDALQHFVAARFGHQLGDDRRAAGRQLVDDRHIQIGVIAHGKRARDRRRAHHQLMRSGDLRGLGLLSERQSLLHAEAVLFIDDDQPQSGELHLLLENGMGADDQTGTAALHQLQCRLALPAGLAAGQPGQRDAQRLQPVMEFAVMLLGQDLGRRHHRHLPAVFDRLQRGHGGDDGLAAADIALQQALHRMRLGQVLRDLQRRTLLGIGQPEAQAFQQRADQFFRRWQRRSAETTALGIMPAHGKLLRQQFIVGQAAPDRLRAVLQLFQRHLRRGRVQGLQASGESGQLVRLIDPSRQCFIEAMLRQCPLNGFAYGRLTQAGSGRVDRRQAGRHRRIDADRPALRMHHLPAEETVAYLAQHTQALTRRQRLDLARVKMQEAQRQLSTRVAQLRNQGLARLVLHFGVDNLAFHLRRVAGTQVTDGGNACFVDIAQRQMQQQPLHIDNAQLLQPRLQRLTELLAIGEF